MVSSPIQIVRRHGNSSLSDATGGTSARRRRPARITGPTHNLAAASSLPATHAHSQPCSITTGETMPVPGFGRAMHKRFWRRYLVKHCPIGRVALPNVGIYLEAKRLLALRLPGGMARPRGPNARPTDCARYFVGVIRRRPFRVLPHRRFVLWPAQDVPQIPKGQ